VRRYVRTIRPARGRIYQEVIYEPGQAMQVDWGHCGQLRIGSTTRKVSVFVAVLCYSRLCYIEFTLSQKKAEFYRAIVHALQFWGGSPRRLIFDNLKAAVLNGSGTCDAAYVQTLLQQERRRRELPSPTEVRPKRQELIDEIDVEDPDPALYDRFLPSDEDEQQDSGKDKPQDPHTNEDEDHDET